MNMMRTMICAALAVCALTATTALAQTAPMKIGIVNSETVIKELPEAKDASAKLESMGSKIQDTLRMMQQEFETKLESFRKAEAMMSADGKKREEETLRNLQMRFQQYQQEKSNEIQQLREQFLAPIREKVSAAISAVAKAEKCSVVLDKAGAGVLFSDDKLDLTFMVLDRLKRGDGK